MNDLAKHKTNICVVDDSSTIRSMIGTAISDHGFQAIMFDCFEDVFRELGGRCQPHVVIA